MLASSNLIGIKESENDELQLLPLPDSIGAEVVDDGRSFAQIRADRVLVLNGEVVCDPEIEEPEGGVASTPR